MSDLHARGKCSGVLRAGAVPQDFKSVSFIGGGRSPRPRPAQTTSLVILIGVLMGELLGIEGFGKGWGGKGDVGRLTLERKLRSGKYYPVVELPSEPVPVGGRGKASPIRSCAPLS